MWAKPSGSIIYNSFLRHIRIFQALGIFPFEEWPKLWFNLYALIYIAVTLPITLMTGIYLLRQTDSILDASEPVLFVGTFSADILKFGYLKLYPNYTRKALEWLNHPAFNHVMEQEKHILDEALKYYSALARIGYCGSFTCTFLWSVTLLVEKTKRPWLPLTEESGIFLTTGVYVIIILGIGYSAMADMSLNIIFSGLIYQATVQTKIIKNIMRNLQVYASKSVTGDVPASEKDDNIYYQISQCAYRYSLIKRFTADVQQAFWFPLLCHIFTASMCYCFLSVKILFMDVFSYEFFSVILLVVSLIFEIINVYIHCFIGDILYFETSTLNIDLYLIDWLGLDLRSKKLFLTLREYTKSPIVIKVTPVLDLSLETFAMIIRRSYSLLTLVLQYKR